MHTKTLSSNRNLKQRLLCGNNGVTPLETHDDTHTHT